MNLNDNNFYYNKLTHKITTEILDGLSAGISFEQLHYYWPFKKIKLLEDEEYLNLTYYVTRIKEQNWNGNDIIGSTGPDYCGYPHVQLSFLYKEKKWIKNHDYKFSTVANVVAHELHHAAQNIQNFSEFKVAKNTENIDNPYVDYFLNPFEVEAYQIGFRAESAISGNSIESCIETYLQAYRKNNLISKEDYDKIYVKWLNATVELVEVQK